MPIYLRLGVYEMPTVLYMALVRMKVMVQTYCMWNTVCTKNIYETLSVFT